MKLLLLGDICLQGVNQLHPEFLNELGHNLERNDLLVVANLECCVNTSGTPNLNKISLFCTPAQLSVLSPWLNVVSIANNHFMDCGFESARETVQLLNAMGIRSFGFGNNLPVARNALVKTIDGESVAFLGYSCLTTNGENYATLDNPGVAPLVLEYVCEDIARVKEQFENIVVSIHWGIEGEHFPTLDQIGVGRRILDAGASIVWGHHPHVIQPIELYGDGYILYSQGNLVFPDFFYEIKMDNGIERILFQQASQNLESLACLFDLSRGKANLESVTPLRYNAQTQTVKTLKLSEQNFDYSSAQKRLALLERKYVHQIAGCRNPDIVNRFNGRIFQTVYKQYPINLIADRKARPYKRYFSFFPFY